MTYDDLLYNFFFSNHYKLNLCGFVVISLPRFLSK